MTAVLVAVGLGILAPTQVKVILESQDPLGKYQARVAPARGLFLKSVLYDNFGKKGWDWKESFPKLGPRSGRGLLDAVKAHIVLDEYPST